MTSLSRLPPQVANLVGPSCGVLEAFMGDLRSLLGVLGALSGVLGIMLGISCAILQVSGWLVVGSWAPVGLENECLVEAPCKFSYLGGFSNEA